MFGKQLAETEGRIVAHLDRHEETIRPVAVPQPDIRKSARITPSVPELRNLDATVARQPEPVRGHTQESRSNAPYLGNLRVEPEDVVHEAELTMEARIVAQAKEKRALVAPHVRTIEFPPKEALNACVRLRVETGSELAATIEELFEPSERMAEAAKEGGCNPPTSLGQHVPDGRRHRAEPAGGARP